MQYNEQIYFPLPSCWFDHNKQPTFLGFIQLTWAKKPWWKTKAPLNVYFWPCTIYRHEYLLNLLRKETPVVKAYPLTTQKSTTLAEVEQYTTLLTEKPTNLVKYNLGKVNLKAMLGWPNAISRSTLWLVYADACLQFNEKKRKQENPSESEQFEAAGNVIPWATIRIFSPQYCE